jgi:hypothetical protein
VVVDLPTKEATHYFRSIRKLSSKDKQCLRLTTIPPLLEGERSGEEFWQKHCGLSLREIRYEKFNVRQSFRKLQGTPRAEKPLLLRLRYTGKEELAAVQKSLQMRPLSFQVKEKELLFSIAPSDRVVTILLGSQPASQATLHYVQRWIAIAQRESPDSKPLHLFAFSAEWSSHTESLFSRVIELIATAPLPRHLSVIPFSFQTDDVIAPLFHRSDITCTRSGGQTAMELMAVSTGQIWIHSEAKSHPGKAPTLDDLLAGIPGWEAANALYLHKMYGATIVTPDSIPSVIQKSACRLRQSSGLE